MGQAVVVLRLLRLMLFDRCASHIVVIITIVIVVVMANAVRTEAQTDGRAENVRCRFGGRC